MIISLTDELVKCNRCGFCLSACPVYQATGLETKAPRGRNALVRALLDKKFSWNKELRESIFQCLNCRACVEACFPAVETDEVVISMRTAYAQEYGEPWLRRYLFRRLLPEPQKLAAAVRQIPLLKRGASLIRVLSFLPWLNRDLFLAFDLLPPWPAQNLRERWANFRKQEGKEKKIAYFGGCAFNFLLPHIGAATLQLLSQSGYEIIWPENGCCGLPAYGHGDLEAARIMARKNIQLFQELDGEGLVTECASCSSFLKKYPSLFPDDPHFQKQAENFSRRVFDISEFLLPQKLEFKNNHPHLKVTFHDPCHLRRFQKIKDQPRQLLQKIPGINFVEMPEADWCCGGGAGLNLAHYNLSMQILERKMANLQKSKAQVLITSCPGCYLQLRHGVKKKNLPVNVTYLTEFLCEV
ncbi:MAG: (Fe-S)-binding protein [Thermodesulfobacteriota bacterium]